MNVRRPAAKKRDMVRWLKGLGERKESLGEERVWRENRGVGDALEETRRNAAGVDLHFALWGHTAWVHSLGKLFQTVSCYTDKSLHSSCC